MADPSRDPGAARRPSRARRLGSRLLVSLAALVLAFLAVEVAARAMGLGIAPRGEAHKLRLTHQVPAEKAPGLHFALAPNREETVVFPGAPGEPDRTVVYATNEHGFRDRSYPKEKPPDAFRIVVLGDSFTFGTAVNADETFPKAMERALADLLPDRRVEVLNWGVYAYNTRQEVALLAARGEEFDPDLVLLCMYVNDASGEGRGDEEQGERDGGWEARWVRRLGLSSGVWAETDDMPAAHRCTMWLRRRSVVADLLANRLFGWLVGRQTLRNYRRDWSEGSPGLELVSRSLGLAVELSRERGFALHATMYPDLHGLEGTYPFEAEHQRAEALCRARGIPFHDLLGVLRGRDSASLHAHEHDKHPNPECHRIVGEHLARELAPAAAAAGG